jgi:predicted DNA-binding transcriptional regulator AlpA
MSTAAKFEKLVDKFELSKLTGISVRKIEMLSYEDGTGWPFYKVGRSVRYKPSEVFKWIEQRKRTK